MTGLISEGEPAGTHVVLGLGSNLADRTALLQRAAEAIGKVPDCHLRAASSLYETPPWGKTDQPAFLNAALLIETDLEASALLAAILSIEKDLGRARRERWGPRLIDIDILVFGTRTIQEDNLKVPHPQLTERAFALLPLVDIAPDTVIDGTRAEDWLSRLETDAITKVGGSDWFNTGRS